MKVFKVNRDGSVEQPTHDVTRANLDAQWRDDQEQKKRAEAAKPQSDVVCWWNSQQS